MGLSMNWWANNWFAGGQWYDSNWFSGIPIEEDELQPVIGGGARPRQARPGPPIHYPPIRRRLGRGFASVKPAGPKEEDDALALILILAAAES